MQLLLLHVAEVSRLATRRPRQTGDCAIDNANHSNVQSDHHKVLQGREASRQNKVVESLYVFAQVTSLLTNTNNLTVEREMTTTLKVINISAYIALYIHICIQAGGPLYPASTKQRACGLQVARRQARAHSGLHSSITLSLHLREVHCIGSINHRMLRLKCMEPVNCYVRGSEPQRKPKGTWLSCSVCMQLLLHAAEISRLATCRPGAHR